MTKGVYLGLTTSELESMTIVVESMAAGRNKAEAESSHFETQP